MTNTAKYLNQKYLEWQSSTGRRATVREWAATLGVSYTSLVGWLNGVHPPSPENVQRLLRAKDEQGNPYFGAELEQVVGIDALMTGDPETDRILEALRLTPPAHREELLALIDQFLRSKGWRKL